jgi:serine/threonine-protein kinase
VDLGFVDRDRDDEMSSDGAEQHLRLVEKPAEPADPLIGQTIDGRYQIEKKLGEGGMGVVYKAKHVMLQKDLAVKVLRADVSKDQEIIARFRQEAQSASGIGSQHIIDISDFGTLDDGSTYFIMEFLDGKELTKVIEQEQPIPPERVAHVGMQLCDALGAAHDRGIVHRDMKPDNVFLVERGGDPDFVKVLDFGIAKVGGASSKLTKAGQVFGTPHYMSPEQCSGQGVDHRTDIYAIGIILYEMACGRVPFDADNLMGILTKHIYEQPIPPHDLPPPVDVPAGLEAVILKCLAKSVDQRYQTMAEVKADLQAFVAGQTPNAVMDAVDRSTGPHARVDPTGRQSALQVEVGGAHEGGGGSKLPLILGAVVGLVALAAVGLGVWFLALAPEQETDPVVEAEPEAPEAPPEPPEPELSAEEQEAQRAAAMEEIEAAADEAEEQVMVTIESDPEGVEVWSSDGVLLGNTPFEVPRPAEGNRLELELRQPGYQNQPVPLSHLSQTTLRVSLEEEEEEETGRARARRGSSARERQRAARRAARAQQQQAEEQAAGGGSAPEEEETQQGAATRRRLGGGSEVLDPWAN